MSTPRNPGSVDIKRLMRVALSKRPNAKKDAAIDMGVDPSALSHWISDESETALPVDLLNLFCASTGDYSVLRYLADEAGFDLVPKHQSKT